MKRESMIIHCSVCHVPFEKEDKIAMDFMNVLTHQSCHRGDVKDIKAFDTYHRITNRYPFFFDNRHR